MTNTMETNKPLILFSVIGISLLIELNKVPATSESTYLSATIAGVLFCIIFPLLNLWFKALWNEISHKIFNLPELNSWQSAGLLALVMFILA